MSPEDIIYGVLSDADLTKIKTWYQGSGKEQIKQFIKEELTEDQASRWKSFDNNQQTS